MRNNCCRKNKRTVSVMMIIFLIIMLLMPGMTNAGEQTGSRIRVLDVELNDGMKITVAGPQTSFPDITESEDIILEEGVQKEGVQEEGVQEETVDKEAEKHDQGLTLLAKELKGDADVKTIREALESTELKVGKYRIFDIALLAGEKEYELNGEVSISFSKTEGFDTLLHYDVKSNKLEEYVPERKGDILSINADKLSVWVLAEKEKEEESGTECTETIEEEKTEKLKVRKMAGTKSGSMFNVVDLNDYLPDSPPPQYTPPDLKPEYHKMIDYLGDNDSVANENPDTSLDDNGTEGLNDYYRLYLDLKGDSNAMDLLLILDESSSMRNKLADNTTVRKDALEEFLNGSGNETGFVKNFLDANSDNRLAVVAFGTTARQVRNWSKSSEEIKLKIYEDEDGKKNKYTNYSAALKVADGVLHNDASHSDNKKMVIFLSDGSPSVVYFDGELRNDNEEKNSVSTISGTDPDSLPKAFLQLMNLIEYNYTNGTQFDSNDRYLRKGAFGHYYKDDRGLEEWVYKSYWAKNGPANNFYPQVGIMRDLGLDIPGCNAELEITDYDAFDAFRKEYRQAYGSGGGTYNETRVKELIKAHCTNDPETIRKVDLNELSEVSFMKFIGKNRGVTMNTIGFSGELGIRGTDFNGVERDSAEVLKFMAKYGAGKYFYVNDATTLAKDMNSMCFMTDAGITDTLSEYADVADVPELKVVCKDTVTNMETVLFNKGALTEEGKKILDSVTLNAATGKLTVKFLPNYAVRKDCIYTASFNVTASEAAYTKYRVDGYIHEGEDGTDYGRNKTSSKQSGFYSNLEAKATWTVGKTEKTGDYEKPVIQCAQSVLFELPSAGSSGTLLYMTAGAMLVTVSLVSIIRRRRKYDWLQ